MAPMHVVAGYTHSAAWGTSCWGCSGPGWSGLAGDYDIRV